MAWDTLGRRKLNKMVDQPIQLANWGNAQQSVQLRAMQDAGYLRALEIEVPQTLITGTPAAGTIALQPSAQLGLLRSIDSFRITTQAIADLVSLHGDDFYFLAYMRQAERHRVDGTINYAFSAPPSAPNGGTSLAGVGTSQSLAGNNVNLALHLYLPMTMDVLLRGVETQLSDSSGKPLAGPDGKPLSAIMDRQMEISLISLQSSELAVQPSLRLNPSYGPGVNNPVLTTGAATATATFSGQLNSYIYDVPTDPADRPNGYQTSMILSRTYVETNVLNSAVEIPFRRAGSLYRVGYLFLDANRNYVDVASTPLGRLQFGWGTRVTKIDETVESNIAACLRRTGQVPPQGLLVHDFFSEFADLNDVINTVRLANITTRMTGLPASVATVRAIEERIIPVKLRPQGA